ncbi:MAG: hypothetical protein NWP37_02180, partial [Pontimonas sp.]|nr:hypothetical protein [Pontimonas sp.]
MSRTPSTLSSLAKAGFARLDEARDRLDAHDFSAEDFSGAADPDLSLKTVADLAEKEPSRFRKLWSDGDHRESLVLLAGSSSGLGDFLKRH